MNDQAGDIQAPRIRIASTDEIAAALDSAGLRLDRSVIVLVGGAGIMGEKEFETVAQVLRMAVLTRDVGDLRALDPDLVLVAV